MSLTGVWLNEHKSIMVIDEHSDRRLTGLFRSVVGRDTRKRPLSGRATSEESAKQLLGFTVCFYIDNPTEATGTIPFAVGQVGRGMKRSRPIGC
jgi:hypothetical protein